MSDPTKKPSESTSIIDSVKRDLELRTPPDFTATELGTVLIHVSVDEEALLFSRLLIGFKWMHYGTFKGFQATSLGGNLVKGIIAGGWESQRHYAAALQARMLCPDIPLHCYFGRAARFQPNENPDTTPQLFHPSQFSLGRTPALTLELDQQPEAHPLEENNDAFFEDVAPENASRSVVPPASLIQSEDDREEGRTASIASAIDTPLVWDWCLKHLADHATIDHGSAPFLLAHQADTLPAAVCKTDMQMKQAVALHPVDPLTEWPLHQPKPLGSPADQKAAIRRMLESAVALVEFIDQHRRATA